jgi:hypothetical protein
MAGWIGQWGNPAIARRAPADGACPAGVIRGIYPERAVASYYDDRDSNYDAILAGGEVVGLSMFTGYAEGWRTAQA